MDEANERFLYVAILWRVDDVRQWPAVTIEGNLSASLAVAYGRKI